MCACNSSLSRESYRSRGRFDPILPGAEAGLELVGECRVVSSWSWTWELRAAVGAEGTGRVSTETCRVGCQQFMAPICRILLCLSARTTSITSQCQSIISLPRWQDNSRSTQLGRAGQDSAGHSTAQHSTHNKAARAPAARSHTVAVAVTVAVMRVLLISAGPI